MSYPGTQHGGYESSQSVFLGRNRKNNLSRASREFTDLLKGRELRFVHFDDHPSIKPRAQPPIPLEEAEPCEGPHGVPIMPIAECNT